MTLNNTRSFIFLSAILVFSSCKKSDSGPGVQPDPGLTITSISPASGPSATLVTIKGTDFTEQDSVFFNGKGAAIVTTSATQLVVKVPPQAGSGNITLSIGSKSVTGPVFNFTGNTYLVSTFAGNGNITSTDGTGTAASFNFPVGIAIDGHDNLYIADFLGNKIRKISPDAVVTTVAGSGAQGSTEGTGVAASFFEPYGVDVDANDNLYVADYHNNKIRKITPGGLVSTLAGSGSLGSVDASGTAASFNGPGAIAVDGSGNVFVADYYNYKIRKITPQGVVSSFAGSGAQGSANGNRSTASFTKINGISFDAVGNLYVADGGNNSIRKIASDGNVTTIAGGSVDGGYADGTGISAMFNSPISVAVDHNGFLYVADQNNQLIRQITPDGAVTLLAGGVGSTGTDDGPALTATFYSPEGMAIDSRGNIFVVDTKNNRIRKLTPQ